jgi:hypothetical protein
MMRTTMDNLKSTSRAPSEVPPRHERTFRGFAFNVDGQGKVWHVWGRLGERSGKASDMISVVLLVHT